MLHQLKELDGLAIHATDGDIGVTKDFYFDDQQWTLRYFIVETGSWLLSRKILLSPMSITHLNLAEKTLSVDINRDQVRRSPEIDTHQPVSRQFEVDYSGYYGFPLYWGDIGLWGSNQTPERGAQTTKSSGAHKCSDGFSAQNKDHQLRSSQEVVGYHIEAHDGEIGHLEGMLIDEETFAIRYLIINTSNWWMGHAVLIAPQWIKEVSWAASKIYVDMTQEQIKHAPEFDPNQPLGREWETSTHEHYGRKGYWDNGAVQNLPTGF
jgi:hypothetical protein